MGAYASAARYESLSSPNGFCSSVVCACAFVCVHVCVCVSFNIVKRMIKVNFSSDLYRTV